MADRILIKGGIVLTQDPELGELPRRRRPHRGRHDRRRRAEPVAPTAPRSSTPTGDIVIPGFIDTHRHTWETSIRTCAPDYALVAYFGSILDKFAPALPARRRLRRQPVGRARVHQRGHHDARRLVAHHEHAGPRRRRRSRASRTRGIRSVFAFGFPNTSLQDWWFGPDWTRQRPDASTATDARRIRKQYFNSDDGLITMALATRGPNFCKPDVVRYEWELAKELGINITVHVAMDRFGYTKMQIDRPPRHGPAVPEHDLRPRLALHRRGVGARPRLRRQRLVRAADRDPDGPRLGAGAEGRPSYGMPVGLSLGRRDHGAVRPVHPDARDLRLGARPQAPGRRGTRTSTGTCRRRDLITSRQVLALGDDGRGEGRRDRRPDRLDHAGQEGRHRDHRRRRRSTSRRSSTRSGRSSARPTSRTSRPSSSTARS